MVEEEEEERIQVLGLPVSPRVRHLALILLPQLEPPPMGLRGTSLGAS